jgi:multidrug efflux pump subunit AcrA (membrane-fusion protein)
MSTFNVMTTGGRPQILVDEQQLQQLQAEANRRGIELERLKAAMEVLSAFNAPAHFLAASMALVNEIAARWKCERVGVGFLKGRYVRLQALSHTEKITRNMQLVQDIEAAMEECLDQDVEVLLPPAHEASYVYRSTETLSSRHGPSAIASFPLRRERTHLKERNDERFGNVVAVLTVERKIDKPFTLQEIETLRLTADLFTARLYDMYENDRWLGAKALRGTRRGLAWVVGAKHTWAKVAAIAVAGFLGFALFVDGTFRVEAPFAIQAVESQIVSAPFDGYLKTVNVDPGDLVMTEKTAATLDQLNGSSPLTPVLAGKRPHTVLATLDTTELLIKRAGYMMEVEKYKKTADLYRADEKKIAEMQAAEMDAKRAQAEADYITWQIDHAAITTPIDGRVFQGDLRTKLGTLLKAADPIFEIGQADLRAELNIPEDEIMDVMVDQKGIFKATSYPNRPIRFTVERITPVATVVNGKNVFKVRVTMDPGQDTAWLKPGVEGLAKIDVEPRRYGWIWTHRMINWVRMKLWM